MKVWKKDLILLATKLIEKIADLSNAKGYFNSYLERNNTGLVRQSKIINQHLKAIKIQTLLP